MERKFTWEIICNDAGQWTFKRSDGTQSEKIYESKIDLERFNDFFKG